MEIREAVRKYPNSFYNGIEAVRCIIKNLPAADVRPKWISVEERLPCQNDGKKYICLLVGGKYDQFQWYDLCDFAEGMFWASDIEENFRVTHWMPLPEPPNCGAEMEVEK